MDRVGQIFGKTLSVSAPAALTMLESALCEGLIVPERWPGAVAEHLFGRKPRIRSSADLSYLAGLAAGGLRSAAFLRAAGLSAQLPILREMARNHTPAVVFCLTDDSPAGLPDIGLLDNSGCFLLSAGTIQEAVDLAVVAHRIAETALVPGIILVPQPKDPASEQEVRFPQAEHLIQTLGTPDDNIPSPTPAQEIIFGKSRRRVPNWYHFDHPTLNGDLKSGLPLALELAANAQFFAQHLPELIQQAFIGTAQASPAALEPYNPYRVTDAEFLVISWGPHFGALTAAVDLFRQTEKIKVGAVQLRQLYPLPAQELSRLFSGKKAITWLEPYTGLRSGAVLPEAQLQAILQNCGKKAPEYYRGVLGADTGPEAIAAALQNMMPRGTHKTNYYLGISFTQPKSEFPQHEILLQTIRRVYPEVSEWTLDYSALPSGKIAAAGTSRLPWAVRRQKDLAPPYARMTRFHHDTGALYAAGALQELVADPFQAVPAIPSGSAGLAGKPAERLNLPVFQADRCTGCGDCMVYCPHAALPALALSVEQILRGAMDIAGKKGAPLTQLTPLLKNLGIIAGQVIRESQTPVTQIGGFLPEAFTRLAEQMRMDPEKQEKVRLEIEQVTALLASLPLAVTDTFFTQPDLQEKGKGALFTLALDTQACTGCGICATVCAPKALEMTPESSILLQQAEQALDIWEQLPDTPAETIARMHRDPEYDSLAAILLSRHNYLTLSGPGPESGAPGKTLLHLLTAVTESIAQPRVAAHYKEIEQLIADLSENIRKKLAEALPSEDSLGLISAIAGAGGRKLPLDEIIGKLSDLEHLKLVDTAALQRKIQLANDLKDLLWVLRTGPNGAGRARYGLALSGNTQDYAGQFPFYPFQAPVLMTPAGSPDLGLGLFDAYLRHAIDNFRLLRRAQLEIKNQYRPEFHDAIIADLDWDQLSAEEKALIPPLLLVCERDSLPANFTERLLPLLAQDRPVKVVILDHCAPAPETVHSYLAARNMLLDLGRSTRNAFVFMGSLAARGPLFDGLLHGIRTQKPALLLLHAPTPAQHRLAGQSWARLPELALHTRAFPSFVFDPEKAGALLASGVSLEANPEERETWATATLKYMEGQEEKEHITRLSFADWLFTLDEWQDHFTEAPAGSSAGVELGAYLQLEVAAREGKKALVFRIGAGGERKQYEVSEQVVEATRNAQIAWNYLRETAGTLSAHPQKLWEEAQTALSEQYEQKIKALQAEFEARAQTMEQEFLQKMRVQLREKLVRLAAAGKKQQELTPNDN